jgi:NAD(P)-dependent dehydrogenase (short-subunit alcohol dehydrogenase family)
MSPTTTAATVVAEVASAFGTIDVLVNNGHQSSDPHHLGRYAGGMAAHVAINLEAVYGQQLVAPYGSQHKGQDHQIASIRASAAAMRPYNAAKGGVLAYTIHGGGTRPPDILVNAVAPGFHGDADVGGKWGR